MRKIGREEISQHRNINDLWLLIDGKVYDVSKYIRNHPGGASIIMRSVKKKFDSTEDFHSVIGRFRGHSESAIEELDDYLIGELSASD
ncbi:Oidioi.mRNA.OKI2018_I69.chr1.g546.t1.cds [Oikopleura dioica]|uniref:Oidioi.mRNA.OKI2018_I69.chr1.g546.t1.cds n=1 Tax=Oikopleura dioica TaxID=34765 RepID=A0ABN7SP19_OIKDI|nr:Oidioi.mRNA.OKI2018_I69.chr1.g546.t1.cds [Oikopleura dioica]